MAESGSEGSSDSGSDAGSTGDASGTGGGTGSGGGSSASNTGSEGSSTSGGGGNSPDLTPVFSCDEAQAPEPLRASLARVGEAVDFAELTKKMGETARAVRGIFEEIVLAAAPNPDISEQR